MRLIEALAAAARRQLEQQVAGDGELRRVWQVIDLILAILRGATMSGLALDPRGFDAINDYDWRDWLRMNGASEQSLDSGFMRGIYDLAFAFEDGDVKRPRLAAGVALRGAMRMFFTYRGALFWRMSAGMGDIVFAPLYQVLKQRGVRFEFFHRLRNVGSRRATGERAPYVQRAGVRRAGARQGRRRISAARRRPRRPELAVTSGLPAARERPRAGARGSRIRSDLGDASRRHEDAARDATISISSSSA